MKRRTIALLTGARLKVTIKKLILYSPTTVADCSNGRFVYRVCARVPMGTARNPAGDLGYSNITQRPAPDKIMGNRER